MIWPVQDRKHISLRAETRNAVGISWIPNPAPKYLLRNKRDDYQKSTRYLGQYTNRISIQEILSDIFYILSTQFIFLTAKNFNFYTRGIEKEGVGDRKSITNMAIFDFLNELIW